MARGALIWTLPLSAIGAADRPRVGGKACALAELARGGNRVPPALCVTTEAYRAYLRETRLAGKILLALHRKDLAQMRWEELWDLALRIRSLFLRTALPPALETALATALDPQVAAGPVVVRSSAPGEDSGEASFAGLHSSFVNVRGMPAVLGHIRRVWASLWSDAALLYRRELGLDVERSAMAVVVQEIVAGERSGVAFTRNPNHPEQAVIEAVHGLNQGLVDGTVAPDRWLLARESGAILGHTPAERAYQIVPAADGVRRVPLPPERAARPPLAEREVQAVHATARAIEARAAAPQDVEWTYRGGDLFLLQARPITALRPEAGEDRRLWYRSLRRSLPNLQALRQRIEGQHLPAMKAEASTLAARDPAVLDDAALAREIDHRLEREEHWRSLYWADFIPFAHGARLFGEVYNDTLQPEDPFAFIDLLTAGEMLSLTRNRTLEALAARVRRDPLLGPALETRDPAALPPDMRHEVEAFQARFGDLSQAVGVGAHLAPAVGTSPAEQIPPVLTRVILALASRPARAEPDGEAPRGGDRAGREAQFLDRFRGEARREAQELLALARASYRLRDDDNLHFGRLQRQVQVAVAEGRRRLQAAGGEGVEALSERQVQEALAHPGTRPSAPLVDEATAPGADLRARQIVGQPAGPGLARGAARVVEGVADLAAFAPGEVLVCDAIEPNMTFVVPLAAAVVERRGGMLIHGAIIAREYGLPCVTGLPEATARIRTGDALTVDGFLGIVTIDRDPPR